MSTENLYLLEPIGYERPKKGWLTGYHNLVALSRDIGLNPGVKGRYHLVTVTGGEMLQSNTGWTQFRAENIVKSEDIGPAL